MGKTVNLKMPGVMELVKNHLLEANGGGIIAGAAGFIGLAIFAAATVEVITEGSAQCWEDFKRGYRSTQ